MSSQRQQQQQQTEDTGANDLNQLVLASGVVVVLTVVLSLALQAFFQIYLLVAVPIMFVYLALNCPSNESFDAKFHLKRVLSGQELPDDHPNKPRGFLGRALAGVNATLLTQISTGMGYEITYFNGIFATAIKVRVPAANGDFYWVGINRKWYYVFSTEINPTRGKYD